MKEDEVKTGIVPFSKGKKKEKGDGKGKRKRLGKPFLKSKDRPRRGRTAKGCTWTVTRGTWLQRKKEPWEGQKKRKNGGKSLK